jgi:hypothetical protein
MAAEANRCSCRFWFNAVQYGEMAYQAQETAASGQVLRCALHCAGRAAFTTIISRRLLQTSAPAALLFYCHAV